MMVSVIKNAVAAEREGNWNIHCATMENAQPMFAEMDSFKYQR